MASLRELAHMAASGGRPTPHYEKSSKNPISDAFPTDVLENPGSTNKKIYYMAK